MVKGFKRYLSKELRQQERETWKRKLRALRQAERAARKQRADDLRSQKEACDARVREADAAAQAEFVRARELALDAQRKATEARRLARAAKKAGARDKCRLEREHVKAEAQAKVDAKRREAAEERAFRRELAAMAKPGPTKAKDRSRRRRERQSESDDDVRQNLPAELQELWQRERRRIKASPLRTRTEAFLDWVHEHPEARLEAQEAALPSDAEMARAERDYWAMVGGEVPF